MMGLSFSLSTIAGLTNSAKKKPITAVFMTQVMRPLGLISASVAEPDMAAKNCSGSSVMICKALAKKLTKTYP